MSERAISERQRLARIKYAALGEDAIEEQRERARERAADGISDTPMWFRYKGYSQDDDFVRVESHQESVYPRDDS